MTLRVAITGVTGDVGRGAMLGLRRNPPSAEPIWILGLNSTVYTDANLNNSVQVPQVREPDYVAALTAALCDYNIDVLLPCIDAEIVILSAAREQIAASGTRMAIAPPELVEAADDKLLTARYLSARGIRTPMTWETAAADAMTFPVVAKPRRGHGSQGVTFLADAAALKEFMVTQPHHYCLQRHITGPEFTVGFLYDTRATLRDAIAMERVLEEGRTVRARVVETPEIQRFISEFGERVPGIGAVNAQLRWDENEGPLVFEINSRLSGSTEMRVAVGCNDPLRLVRHFGRGEPIAAALPQMATVYRRGSELLVDPC